MLQSQTGGDSGAALGRHRCLVVCLLGEQEKAQGDGRGLLSARLSPRRKSQACWVWLANSNVTCSRAECVSG